VLLTLMYSAVDLMSRMLTFNPNKRISVNDALDHNYFKSLRLKDTEIECELPFNFDFEKMKLTVMSQTNLYSWILKTLY